jgi:hypothetical protein
MELLVEAASEYEWHVELGANSGEQAHVPGGKRISQKGGIALCEGNVMDTCATAALVVFCCEQSRTRQNCERE